MSTPFLARRRPGGLPGLGAEVPGRAPPGPAGLRVVPQRPAPGGPAAHEPPPAAADRRPSRALLPAAAPSAPRPTPQTAAGDAGQQGLNASVIRSVHLEPPSEPPPVPGRFSSDAEPPEPDSLDPVVRSGPVRFPRHWSSLTPHRPGGSRGPPRPQTGPRSGPACAPINPPAS